MIPNDLKAKPGDKILEKYKKLVAYIDSQKLRSVDERVQIEETGNGTNVMLRSKVQNLTFEHPLKIRLISEDYYTVDEGYVNSRIPFVRTEGRKGKILHSITSPDGIGVIPKNINTPDIQWLFCCTFVTNQQNQPLVNYIECINTELLDRQDIKIGDLFLGKSHIAREVDFVVQPKFEYYIPMAFMRLDKVIHNFCWHNIIVRPYKIGITNRIIFFPA